MIAALLILVAVVSYIIPRLPLGESTESSAAPAASPHESISVSVGPDEHVLPSADESMTPTSEAARVPPEQPVLEASTSQAPPSEVGSTAPLVALPEGAIVAAPDGSATGSGAPSDPLDLPTAIGEASPVESGGNVLLRGGVYPGVFTSAIEGSPSAPIVVRSFPGEWAVLDGIDHRASTLTVAGADTWFRDFEVTKSDAQRVTSEEGSKPSLSRGDGAGVVVTGARTKLINLVIHDNGNGVSFRRPAVDAELYGLVIFNNGWIGSDRPHGHGIYVQNETGTKRIENCVVFNNFRYGIQGFGLNGHVSGIQIDRVTSFENGKPSGQLATNLLAGTSKNPSDEIHVTSGTYYSTSPNLVNVVLGFNRDVRNEKATVRGNVISGGFPAFAAKNWSALNIQENLFMSRHDETFGPQLTTELWTPSWRNDELLTQAVDYRWDQNAYHELPHPDNWQPAKRFIIDAPKQQRRKEGLTFEEWRRESGLDARSTHHLGAPDGVDVRVVPNTYEPGRATISILNWDLRASVDVDLDEAGLERGASYEIRDAEDYLGPPVLVGTHDGRAVTIPMDLSSVTQPVGAPRTVEHTSRAFGAYIVIPLPNETAD